MTTEVRTSTKDRISEDTRIILQEALEEENKKDTPSFGNEDLEKIHRSGTEAGLLGIYNFPGSVFPYTDMILFGFFVFERSVLLGPYQYAI